MTREQAPVNRTDLSRIIATVNAGDGSRPGRAQMQALREIGALGKQRSLTIIGIQLPIIQGAVDVLNSDKDWNGYRDVDRGTWRLLQSIQMRKELMDMGIHYSSI